MNGTVGPVTMYGSKVEAYGKFVAVGNPNPQYASQAGTGSIDLYRFDVSKDRMLTMEHPDLFLHMVQVVLEVVLDQVELVVLPFQKMAMVSLLICMKTFLLWVMNILQDHILVRHILMLVLWMYTY